MASAAAVWCCAGLSALLLGWPTEVHADLMLYPTRVVLSGRTRSAQVELVNRSTLTQTFRISLVDRRMTETGDIVAASGEEDDPRSAQRLLVFTPRQITLPAGQTQTVRISARKPAELAEGEYRSHLQFDRISTTDSVTEASPTSPDSGQVAVALQTLVGASIPVIVRHGRTTASAALADLSLLEASDPSRARLRFSLTREGNQSVYGDLVATFQAAGRPIQEVGRMNGVAVYVPNASRSVSLGLNVASDLLARGGTLKLQFRERPDAGGGLLAETELIVR